MRSTTLAFGLLFVAASTAVAQGMGSASKGEKSSSSGSSTSTVSSTSSSPPATISKGSSEYAGSSSSSGSMSSWKSPASTGYRTPSRETFGDTRTKSEYTRPSVGTDLFADRKEIAWQKQRMDLRESLELKAFIQKLQMEVAHKQAKEYATVPTAAAKAPKTGTVVTARTDDVNPPLLPPSPNKATRFDPTKTTVPVNNNGNYYYDQYLYNLYLRSLFFNNSMYGFCSPFDTYWTGMNSRYGYGYGMSQRSLNDWRIAQLYMNMGFWGNDYAFSPFYNMSPGYGPYGGYSYGYGGYGYGPSMGCAGFMGGYANGMYGSGLDDNHSDRCAVVTVDTYGDAKYQLRINPSSLKLKSAEELEKKLNEQLQKNETIFLVDDEGYELQLTPGTARKFSVEHCDR